MSIQIFTIVCIIYASLRLCPKQTIKLLSIICIPFIKILIYRRILNGLEEKDRINERFGTPSQKRPIGKLIWIHAVSVGETLSVIPIIDIIKREKPDISILLTTTTVTAAKQVEHRLKNKVIHQYIPFDIFPWIKKFIRYWNPSAVFFVESELWANILFYLYSKNIPMYLLNARISKRSIKRMMWLKKYFGILPFSLFEHVFTSTSEMKNLLEELGAKKTQILPNLKILSDKLPVNQKNKMMILQKIANRQAWIAISTHPGEEEIVIKAHKLIKEKFPDILTIVAIRHPSRKTEVEQLAIKEGILVSVFSEAMKNYDSINEDLLIIDRMGCLGDFFAIIDTVLVCGSLIPGIGGHNFIEPLQFDCNVATGKYIENFNDLYPIVNDNCQMVETPEDICLFVMTSKRNGCLASNKLDINLNKNEWLSVIKTLL